MMRGFTPDADSNTPGICTAVQNMVPYRAGMEAAATQLDAGGNAVAAAVTGAVHEAALHLVDADVATFAKAKRDAALESLLLSDGRNRGHSRRTDLPVTSAYNIARGY